MSKHKSNGAASASVTSDMPVGVMTDTAPVALNPGEMPVGAMDSTESGTDSQPMAGEMPSGPMSAAQAEATTVGAGVTLGGRWQITVDFDS